MTEARTVKGDPFYLNDNKQKTPTITTTTRAI